jgi:hypothetical protein
MSNFRDPELTKNSILVRLVQRSRDVVQRWCKVKEQFVNPNTTHLVHFAKRKAVQGFMEPSPLNFPAYWAFGLYPSSGF